MEFEGHFIPCLVEWALMYAEKVGGFKSLKNIPRSDDKGEVGPVSILL